MGWIVEPWDWNRGGGRLKLTATMSFTVFQTIECDVPKEILDKGFQAVKFYMIEQADTIETHDGDDLEWADGPQISRCVNCGINEEDQDHFDGCVRNAGTKEEVRFECCDFQDYDVLDIQKGMIQLCQSEVA